MLLFLIFPVRSVLSRYYVLIDDMVMCFRDSYLYKTIEKYVNSRFMYINHINCEGG